jgi:hypothetical protein
MAGKTARLGHSAQDQICEEVRRKTSFATVDTRFDGSLTSATPRRRRAVTCGGVPLEPNFLMADRWPASSRRWRRDPLPVRDSIQLRGRPTDCSLHSGRRPSAPDSECCSSAGAQVPLNLLNLEAAAFAMGMQAKFWLTARTALGSLPAVLDAERVSWLKVELSAG